MFKKIQMILLLGILFSGFFMGSGTVWSAFFHPDIRPGYGVTSQAWLSKYFPPSGGPFWTPRFITSTAESPGRRPSCLEGPTGGKSRASRRQ